MESYSLRGKVYEVFDINHISDKFWKREFIVEVSSSSHRGTYIEYIKLQTIMDNCDLLDSIEKGDLVVVKWALSGRKWGKKPEEKFFTNVEALDINIVSKASGEGYDDEIDDELPLEELKKDVASLSFPKQIPEDEVTDLPF